MTVKANILVTCANRKAVPTAPELMLRAISGDDLEDRARVWTQLLDRSEAPTSPACDLYAGDHWQIVRSLEATAKAADVEVTVWISSAGYGLVPLCASLRSYAATFSSGHSDSVVFRSKHFHPKVIRRNWWSALSRWPGPGRSVRTLTDLARQSPGTPLLVAASPPYLDAMAADLEGAASVLDDGRLAIFCGGDWSIPALQTCLVPCDARLQSRLGGARTSLNVRCVRHALAGAKGDLSRLTVPKLSQSFASLLRGKAAPQPAGRSAQSDEEVLSYVRAALDSEPELSATRLLCRLRASGRACEQSRFGRLFRQARGVTHG